MSLVARMVLASFCVLLAQNSFSRTNNIPYKKQVGMHGKGPIDTFRTPPPIAPAAQMLLLAMGPILGAGALRL